MVVYGGVEHDGRVRRAAATLGEAGHDVTIGCLAGVDSADGELGLAQPQTTLDGARIVAVPVAVVGARLPGSSRAPTTGGARSAFDRIGQAVWLIGYGRALQSWRAGLLARLEPADVWYGHDLFGVWAAAALQHRHGGRLVYDSHELFMEAGTAAALPSPARRRLAGAERRLARQADAVITVNPAIAAELARRYGVAPSVVMNVPRGWRLPTRDRLREALPIGDRLVVLYHGAVSPGRGVEQLVETSLLLPPQRAVVVLGDGPLSDEVTSLAMRPPHRGRLYIHPSVQLEELPDWVGHADAGVIAFQATPRNNFLGTPNKLFDYLVAGVPVVVSDFPEMRRLVEQVDGGVTCDPADSRSIATGLDQLLDPPAAARAASRSRLATVAGTRYGWAAQAEVLLDVIGRVVSRR